MWNSAAMCEVAATGRTGQRTPFAAQLPVRRMMPELAPLTERQFKHVMCYTAGNKFELTLDGTQTRELVQLLVSGHVEGGAAGGGTIVSAAGGKGGRKER